MSDLHLIPDPGEAKIRRAPDPVRLIVIPARMASRRLPGKPLVRIAGRSLLEWTVRAARRVPGACVAVTSPDREICHEAALIGCQWMPSSDRHPAGTYRAAEIVERARLPKDSAVVVWQVDEPLVHPGDVSGLFDWLLSGPFRRRKIGTLVAPIDDEGRKHPDTVKVAVSLDRCHWFSRAPLLGSMAHVGVYGFAPEALLELVEIPPSGLAEEESLEQLTWIEAGWEIAALSVPELPPSVNAPEDLEPVRRRLERMR